MSKHLLDWAETLEKGEVTTPNGEVFKLYQVKNRLLQQVSGEPATHYGACCLGVKALQYFDIKDYAYIMTSQSNETVYAYSLGGTTIPGLSINLPQEIAHVFSLLNDEYGCTYKDIAAEIRKKVDKKETWEQWYKRIEKEYQMPSSNSFMGVK